MCFIFIKNIFIIYYSYFKNLIFSFFTLYTKFLKIGIYNINYFNKSSQTNIDILNELHTLDKQKDEIMNVSLPRYNSNLSASADKLLLYLGKDTFFFPPSIHLMYKDWYLILIQSRLNDLSINDRFIILSNKIS